MVNTVHKLYTVYRMCVAHLHYIFTPHLDLRPMYSSQRSAHNRPEQLSSSWKNPLLFTSPCNWHTHACRLEIGHPSHLLTLSPSSCRKDHRVLCDMYCSCLAGLIGEHLLLIASMRVHKGEDQDLFYLLYKNWFSNSFCFLSHG